MAKPPRAVIFDFNGVIVDDEPIHFKLLRRILQQEGIAITEEGYYARYLGFSDDECFEAAFRDAGREIMPEKVGELAARKSKTYIEEELDNAVPLPGALELIQLFADRGTPMAIASGANLNEIHAIAHNLGIARHFLAVVSTVGVGRGKPDPWAYEEALRLIREKSGHDISPQDCLAFEDSIPGIESAHAAGMRCVAVAGSRPASELTQADFVVESLEDFDPAKMA